ncbi:hypothetical protein JCM5350_000102 [Sporobolomyces pararoseus]
MARGNQRDLAREKAQKKQAQMAKSKPKESATKLAARQESDADIMRKKQEAAAAKKAAEAAGAAVKK